MPELYSKSELMILDFNQIPKSAPDFKNIKLFFENSRKNGKDPKLPENRQAFNNNFLEKTNKRYLISRYAEDRIEMLRGSKIAEEGRTIHLGIDIFSKDLEPVSAPCDCEVVYAGKEEGGHGWGHFIVIKPDTKILDNYILLAHLSKNLPKLAKFSKGQVITHLGDHMDFENGGWSRHLHVQLIHDFSKNDPMPIGYSTRQKLKQNMIKYPDPSVLVFS